MTTKAIIVLRHGKSDWDADNGDDLARPLAERGSRSAAAVGRFLAAVDHVPDIVLCSPATRAAETAHGAVAAGDWRSPIRVCEPLYFGSLAAIVEQICGQPAEADVVALVGHEPTSSNLIAELIGGGRHRVPTAALARIGFDTESWSEIGTRGGRLEWLIPPGYWYRPGSDAAGF